MANERNVNTSNTTYCHEYMYTYTCHLALLSLQKIWRHTGQYVVGVRLYVDEKPVIFGQLHVHWEHIKVLKNMMYVVVTTHID